MAGFIKGDIVVIPFPFSDLSNSKRRPALVISGLQGDDLILCQITSKDVKDVYSVSLHQQDFKAGALSQDSNIRPNKLFTADERIINYKIGSLNQDKIEEVINSIVQIVKG